MTKRIISVLLCIAVAVGFLPNAVSAGQTDEQTAAPTVEQIAAMAQYDGREHGIVTPVRDQGGSNLCWAYSSVAASETSILKSGIDPTATATNLKLNPQSAAYHVFNRGADPLGNTAAVQTDVNDYTMETGDPYKIAALYSMWWGPSLSDNAKEDPHESAKYRLNNAVYIPENKKDSAAGIAAVKKAIAEYGAVTFQYNNMRETDYYNPKNETASSSSPHACTLIGWDDTIPAERFTPGGATQNGGWLVKNSYSSKEYFYLSYDNTSTVMYAFDYVTADTYDCNYHYDGEVGDFSLRNDKQAANVYQAKGAAADRVEYLKAVNVGVNGENYTLQVQVYTGLTSSASPTEGGTLAATKTVTKEHGGFVTVELDEQVELTQGEWFSVVAKITSGDATIKQCQRADTPSFAGESLSKLPSFTNRIKALTVLEDDWNFTNLVVFCKFNGESEFVNAQYNNTTVREIWENTYSKSTYSVKDYFSTVSDGAVNLKTLYLFDEDNSLTLSHSRGYYFPKRDNQNTVVNEDGYESGEEDLRRAELEQDWGDAVKTAIANGSRPVDANGKVYSLADLDRDGNGELDLVTIIYKNTEQQNLTTSWGSVLYDYQTYSTRGIKVTESDKTYGVGKYLQMTGNYTNPNGLTLYRGNSDGLTIMQTQAKICHETMHAMGLKDLYRNDQSSRVGYMSLMGKHGSVAQYISVKEREALGWLSETQIQPLAEDGTYTISQVAAKNSIIAYRRDLPNGKTLYLEYRDFTDTGNKYDRLKKDLTSVSTGYTLNDGYKKSGLVLYLATTDMKFPSNLITSGNTWNMECIPKTETGTMNQSAIAAGETLEYYCDGKWVTFTVTEMNAGTLTFTVSNLPKAVEPVTTPTPTVKPTTAPTPTVKPTAAPTPTVQPTTAPTPTVKPTTAPTPTVKPTTAPTPTVKPTTAPTPTVKPTTAPTPTVQPTTAPTPTVQPTTAPTPTVKPTAAPTPTPTVKPAPNPPAPAPMPNPEPDPDPEASPSPSPSPTVSPAPKREWNDQFKDVKKTDWYYDSVKFAYENNLFSGTSETTFEPKTGMTRAMFVQVLYNLAGQPTVLHPAGGEYTDVKNNAYYRKAVYWAAQNNVASGTGGGKFSPDEQITREEMVTMLWNYLGRLQSNGKLNSFKDNKQVSSWAEEALRWAIENGVISGKGNGVLDPLGTATRGEVSAMMKNHLTK